MGAVQQAFSILHLTSCKYQTTRYLTIKSTSITRTKQDAMSVLKSTSRLNMYIDGLWT